MAMLVVDKPAGLHTAPLRPGETGTLLDMVIAEFPEVAAVPGVKPVEPGLVHRLDRGTSGLVVVARTAEAFAALRRLFAAGGACKGYLAACACGSGAGREGERVRIASRFAPFGAGRRMVRVVLPEENSGRLLRQAARETYATEAEISREGPGRALLSTRIERGFRHQVRAHLAFLGYPILGDPLYGAAVPEGYPQRMYLHAARIEMTHPLTGKALIVESPAPAEFGALFPGSSGAP
jgi:23S rRNA pseudouridine1911/1915/1917 synthase